MIYQIIHGNSLDLEFQTQRLLPSNPAAIVLDPPFEFYNHPIQALFPDVAMLIVPRKRRYGDLSGMISGFLANAPDGMILDPFAGQGTTLRECIKDERDCLLVEKERQYVDLLLAEFPQLVEV